MWAQVIVAQALSCPKACGTFLDQGSNPYPLHLAGRFPSTVPPGKSNSQLLHCVFFSWYLHSISLCEYTIAYWTFSPPRFFWLWWTARMILLSLPGIKLSPLSPSLYCPILFQSELRTIKGKGREFKNEQEPARTSLVQKVLHVPCFLFGEKSFSLLSLPWVPKNRLNQLLIREVRAYRKKEKQSGKKSNYDLTAFQP